MPVIGAMLNFTKFPSHIALMACRDRFARNRASNLAALLRGRSCCGAGSYPRGIRGSPTNKSRDRPDASDCAACRWEPTVPHEHSGGQDGDVHDPAAIEERHEEELQDDQKCEADDEELLLH